MSPCASEIEALGISRGFFMAVVLFEAIIQCFRNGLGDEVKAAIYG